MEFEVLKKSHLKRNIVIGVLIVGIISTIILNFTRAKYRVTQSIPLVNGTINYSLADLNIVSLYIDGVEVEELDSSKNYILDTSKSTCTYKNGSTIDNLSISYDSETGGLSISPYTTKGTKCRLYFEETVLVRDSLLANYPTKLTRSSFTSTVTNTTTGTIYYADTSKGRTYYFAGNPTDNWVKFGGFYWRIIRINEDGTLRIIYSGDISSGPVEEGESTQISTSAFNSTYNDNMYVGYMYQSNQVHGLSNNSAIKRNLDTWYQSNLTSLSDKIDGNAGFCGDRVPNIENGGTGETRTYYGSSNRLSAPTFECENDNDLYTSKSSAYGNKVLDYPIGLITADEVVYAGGVWAINNGNYYLYTGESYWTMSPYRFNNSNAYVFYIYSRGTLYGYNNVTFTYGIRPVINLKADVTISSGNGTSSNPYIIQ